jgi:hypothetical protein
LISSLIAVLEVQEAEKPSEQHFQAMEQKLQLMLSSGAQQVGSASL